MTRPRRRRAATAAGLLAWQLGAAAPLSASATLLVHEPIGLEAEIAGAGHAAVYLANVCTDDAITVRLCRPGEEGVVLSTYPTFLPGSDAKNRNAPSKVYWLAVPLGAYLYGSAAVDPPLYSSRAIIDFVRAQFGAGHPLFGTAGFDADRRPAGNWRLVLGNALKRNIYGLSVETTAEQDAMVVAALNDRQGRRAFDFSYNNCSDFVRFVFNSMFPGALGRDVFNDFSLTSPKAIARTLVGYAKEHPELALDLSRYRQVEGPVERSRPNRSISEQVLSSRKYFPMMLALGPGTTVAMTVLSGLRRLDFEELFQDYEPAASAGEWKRHRAEISRLADEAVSRRLFANRRALARFSEDLQHYSAPVLDDRGRLALQVTAGGAPATIGVTEAGIGEPSSHPRLSYQLMLSLAAAEIDRRTGPMPTAGELVATRARLSRLRARDGVWTDAGDLSCPAGAICAAPPQPSWWQRLLRTMFR